jgi:hypothetical protein
VGGSREALADGKAARSARSGSLPGRWRGLSGVSHEALADGKAARPARSGSLPGRWRGLPGVSREALAERKLGGTARTGLSTAMLLRTEPACPVTRFAERTACRVARTRSVARSRRGLTWRFAGRPQRSAREAKRRLTCGSTGLLVSGAVDSAFVRRASWSGGCRVAGSEDWMGYHSVSRETLVVLWRVRKSAYPCDRQEQWAR